MKAFAAILFVCLATAGGADDAVDALISQAGNANDERERQTALEKLAALPSLGETRRTEARALAEISEKWNGSALKFYGASVRGKPHRAIGDYDFGVAADSALRPIAELYRGRVLAWTLIENSTVRTDSKESRWFKDEAVASFGRVAAAFPQNQVARMRRS